MELHLVQSSYKNVPFGDSINWFAKELNQRNYYENLNLTFY